MTQMVRSLLSIENLTVEFHDRSGPSFRVLHDISFDIMEGEILGLIGESGAGKSVLGHSVMGLLDGYPGIIKGRIVLKGDNVLEGLSYSGDGTGQTLKGIRQFRRWRKEYQRRMKKIRGKQLGMIFQEPFKSMDPLFTVRDHIVEALHNDSSSGIIGNNTVLDLLRSVRLDNPEKVQNQYVFELSGGMIQRVMIAIALATKPALIIADEPTTALDTVTQKTILDLIQQKSKEIGQSLLFITHDLGIAARYFDRIAVLFGGRIVEIGSCSHVTGTVISHPYTLELLQAAVGLKSQNIERRKELLDRDSSGCIFKNRCREHFKICMDEDPPLFEVEKGYFIRCWKYR